MYGLCGICGPVPALIGIWAGYHTIDMCIPGNRYDWCLLGNGTVLEVKHSQGFKVRFQLRIRVAWGVQGNVINEMRIIVPGDGTYVLMTLLVWVCEGILHLEHPPEPICEDKAHGEPKTEEKSKNPFGGVPVRA